MTTVTADAPDPLTSAVAALDRDDKKKIEEWRALVWELAEGKSVADDRVRLICTSAGKTASDLEAAVSSLRERIRLRRIVDSAVELAAERLKITQEIGKHEDAVRAAATKAQRAIVPLQGRLEEIDSLMIQAETSKKLLRGGDPTPGAAKKIAAAEAEYSEARDEYNRHAATARNLSVGKSRQEEPYAVLDDEEKFKAEGHQMATDAEKSLGLLPQLERKMNDAMRRLEDARTLL